MNNKNMNKYIMILVAVVTIVLSSLSVSSIDGLDMNNLELTLSGRELSQTGNNLVAIKKNTQVPVEICFVPTQDVTLYFEFAIVGGKYRDLDVRADTGKKIFYKAGVYDCAQTEFKKNKKVDIGNYTLRVFSFDKESSSAASGS